MIEIGHELVERARGAAQAAYARYSKFRVGAAVSAGGIVYTGCNIENASYGLTMCAERVAIFGAIASGARRIDAIAISCIDALRDSAIEEMMPCGACRQVMAEFGDPNLKVFVDEVGLFTLGELLPKAFSIRESR